MILLLFNTYSTSHRHQFFVDYANSEGEKCFGKVWLKLIILFRSGILPPNSGEDQKKVFATFWFHLSPEFRTSCCKVGITCQKTEGARHISPFQCQTRGSAAPGCLKIDAYGTSYPISEHCNKQSTFVLIQ